MHLLIVIRFCFFHALESKISMTVGNELQQDEAKMPVVTSDCKSLVTTGQPGADQRSACAWHCSSKISTAKQRIENRL